MANTTYTEFIGEAEANERLCGILGERFKNYRRQWEQATNCELLTDFPLFLAVEQQFVCNLRCIHCIHGHEELKREHFYPDEMDFQLYKRIIDEASAYGCPSIALNGTNEPLLLKDLAERVRYAADRGFIDTMIYTNALLLSEQTAARLLDAGLTRLIVSLDAFSRETYDKIRVGSNYQRVLDNIHRFLDMRAKRNRQLPFLRISLVRMSCNETEIPAFVEYWAKRADYIAIQEFMAPAPGEEFDSFFAGSRPVIKDFSCPQSWQRFVVQGDGSVLPCCSQFGQELALGNVKELSLHSMWRSPQMDRLRALHKQGLYRKNPTCAKCVGTWVAKEGTPSIVEFPKQLAS